MRASPYPADVLELLSRLAQRRVHATTAWAARPHLVATQSRSSLVVRAPPAPMSIPRSEQDAACNIITKRIQPRRGRWIHESPFRVPVQRSP